MESRERLHVHPSPKGLRSISTTDTPCLESIVRNRRLFEKVQALKTDDRALEEAARRTLGVVRDNEIVYMFDSPSGDPH